MQNTRSMLSLCTTCVIVYLIDFSGVLPLLVDAARELALTLSQMRKFVVPKARLERVAVMAAKAGVANTLGLSWPPPLKKRVGRPSRPDLYVWILCQQTFYTGRACLVGV